MKNTVFFLASLMVGIEVLAQEGGQKADFEYLKPMVKQMFFDIETNLGNITFSER